MDYPRFGCEDINGDKIPELFIFRNYYKNFIGGYDIYTYKNGKPQYVSKITGEAELCILVKWLYVKTRMSLLYISGKVIN